MSQRLWFPQIRVFHILPHFFQNTYTLNYIIGHKQDASNTHDTCISMHFNSYKVTHPHPPTRTQLDMHVHCKLTVNHSHFFIKLLDECYIFYINSIKPQWFD